MDGIEDPWPLQCERPSLLNEIGSEQGDKSVTCLFDLYGGTIPSNENHATIQKDNRGR